MPTVELVVIARNEAAVIGRALDSAKDLVDSMLVYVDGATTDDTAKIAEAHGARVVHGPTQEVLEARNSALEHVKADYALSLDADDVLEGEFSRMHLILDHYDIDMIDGGWRYARPGLFRMGKGYRYEGVAHETIVAPPGAASGKLEKLFYRRIGGGSESIKPDKLLRRGAKLEEYLQKNPADARARFYCGMSFREGGQYERAIHHFRVRVAIPGWDEETFYAQFELAKALEQSGNAAAPENYLLAHEMRPSRAEPLFELARYYRERGRHALAYLYALRASEMPEPNDRLFVDRDVYKWKALSEAAVAAKELRLEQADRLLVECGKRI